MSTGLQSLENKLLELECVIIGLRHAIARLDPEYAKRNNIEVKNGNDND